MGTGVLSLRSVAVTGRISVYRLANGLPPMWAVVPGGYVSLSLAIDAGNVTLFLC